MKYEVDNNNVGVQQNISTTYGSTSVQVAVFATTGALCRGKLVEFAFGADGAPNASDTDIVYDVSRMTADGTGTAATPVAQDTAGTAAASTAKVNYTVSPTDTATSSVKSFSLNQRASQRWVAGPDDKLTWPATAASGLVFRALSPVYASQIMFNVTFEE